MDRDSLEGFLAQDLSLAEIGRREGLHEATVGAWVARHGLAAAGRSKHAARGAISREALGAQVAASIAEIAELLSRSKATVRYWLGKYEMRTHGTRGRRARPGSDEARARGLTKAILVCPVHGASSHARESRGHLDPATKESGVAHAGAGRSIERLRVEARMCILLCSNCHAEVEAGFVSIS